MDILLLPYNYVLSESIRNSIKLKLKKKIIIFDEAHNIEDAAESASSVTLMVNELKYILQHIDNQPSSKSTYNLIMSKNPISKTIYSLLRLQNGVHFKFHIPKLTIKKEEPYL